MSIRNKNTREAYLRAARDLFAWSEARGLRALEDIEPPHGAAWVESLTAVCVPATVKQRLPSKDRTSTA